MSLSIIPLRYISAKNSFGRLRGSILRVLILVIIGAAIPSALSAQSAGKTDCKRLRFVQAAEHDDPANEKVSYYGTDAPLELTGADLLDGCSVAKAEAIFDDFGRRAVLLTLTPEGSTIFARETKRLIGKQIAIVFDNKVLICPRVMLEIPGGKVQITGSFTAEEIKTITTALNGKSE